MMERFTAELGNKFKFNVKGNPKYYMGCNITRECKTRGLKLDQNFYGTSMLERIEKASGILGPSGYQPSQMRTSHRPRKVTRRPQHSHTRRE